MTTMTVAAAYNGHRPIQSYGKMSTMTGAGHHHSTQQGQDDRQVTIAEWAPGTGRTETSIKTHWRGQPGFPSPVGRRKRPGVPGPGEPLFSLAALENWRAEWETTRERPVPTPFEVPGDPNSRQTLGSIARQLGVAGSTLTQYREIFDEQAAYEDRGARRHYRVGDVINLLNSRKGAGVARDPAHDRRRAAFNDSRGDHRES